MTRSGMVLLITGLLTWSATALPQAASGHNNRRILRVSLIQVIANPKEFDGQRLRIVGYLGNNGIDKAVGVFVSEVDGRNFVLSNSIDLHLSDSQASALNGKYVVFSGTYHAPIPQSDYNGYIDQILDIEPWGMGNALK